MLRSQAQLYSGIKSRVNSRRSQEDLKKLEEQGRLRLQQKKQQAVSPKSRQVIERRPSSTPTGSSNSPSNKATSKVSQATNTSRRPSSTPCLTDKPRPSSPTNTVVTNSSLSGSSNSLNSFDSVNTVAINPTSPPISPSSLYYSKKFSINTLENRKELVGLLESF